PKPVSSLSSRAAASAWLSPSRRLPVTDCQKPNGWRRLRSRASPVAANTTTRTDSGRRGAGGASSPEAGMVGARSGLRTADPDTDLTQLLRRDLAGRPGQRAGRRLRLRERDHLPDALLAGHQHDEAIEPESDAAHRRRAVLQRTQQEPELFLRLLAADLEQLEDGRLHRLVVDTDRAAADLVAVEHEVVGTGLQPPRVRPQVGRRAGGGGGERVMQGRPALRGEVALEHREVDDPERPPALLDQPPVLAELHAERSQRVVHDARLVGAEEHEVAVRGARAIENA